MNVDFVGNSVEPARQLLDSSLDEQSVDEPALLRTPVDLLRYLRKGPRTRINPDIKPLRVPASAMVYKATVAGPDIDYDPAAGTISPPVRRNELLETFSIKSSSGVTTNDLYHKLHPFNL
jgi:hypothetical protein